MPILYLIPNTLDQNNYSSLIYPELIRIVPQINHFICEHAKPARRRVLAIYQAAGQKCTIEDLYFYPIEQFSADNLLRMLSNVQGIGLLSDAGCPGIADPGQVLVRIAHQLGWTIKPLVGGVSIMLTLMSSGLNGQQFQFVGYLPRQNPNRQQRLKQIDRQAQTLTTLFIETPYRNQSLLNDCLTVLNPDTWLCVATGLTTPTEHIISQPVQRWRIQPQTLPKIPAVFAIGKP